MMTTGPQEVSLREATRVVLRNGFTPVNTAAYERLRAWCDVNGWPPKGWQPERAGGEPT